MQNYVEKEWLPSISRQWVCNAVSVKSYTVFGVSQLIPVPLFYRQFQLSRDSAPRGADTTPGSTTDILQIHRLETLHLAKIRVGHLHHQPLIEVGVFRREPSGCRPCVPLPTRFLSCRAPPPSGKPDTPAVSVHNRMGCRPPIPSPVRAN